MKDAPELGHIVHSPDDPDSEYYSVNYIGLVGHLVRSVQELNQRVKELEAERDGGK